MNKTLLMKRIAIFGVILVLTVAVMFLLESIAQHKQEAKEVGFRIANLSEDIVDPAIWGRNFPFQYDQYLRTVDTIRTKYGGSEAFSKLDNDPRLREIFAGYAFSIDYREERGHAYMLSDQRQTERVLKKKQPGACIQCHGSVLKMYRDVGVKNGASDKEWDRLDAIKKGFEIVCAMPFDSATKLVSHPVACIDCHDPKTMQLRVWRPGFLNGIARLAESNDPLPQYPSIERWRKSHHSEAYDPNKLASRQEMRTFVCGQCHVEYYFKGDHKLLTYPWHNGLQPEKILAYYDTVKFFDWKHAISNAPVLKAQHPEFETFTQGIHSRAGVACADCHMPYMRQGAVKISDHQVRSPLLNVNRACQVCHAVPEAELINRVDHIQNQNKEMLDRAENALVNLIRVIDKAQKSGATDQQLEKARDFNRKAQWFCDFVNAENSMGFHANQESARVLAEAIDYARQGEIEVLKFSQK